MTTIAPRIKKILAIVEELKEAIRNKGVDVPETALFPELPDYINQIVTLDFDFTELVTDTFSQPTDEIPDTAYALSTFSQPTDEIPDTAYALSTFSQPTDSQILFNTSGFTIVGSPSISNDGLISGLSTSSYLTTNVSDIFTSSNADYTMSIRFKTGSSKVQQTLVYQNKGIIAEINPNNVLYLFKWNGSSSSNTLYTVEADTWYILEFTGSYDTTYNTTYNLYSNNKAELLASATYTDSSIDLTYADVIGIGMQLSSKAYPFLGTVDINNTYINNITDGIYWKPSVTIENLTL